MFFNTVDLHKILGGCTFASINLNIFNYER